uniref:Uncharacterized protein n=1 Tax=Strombidium inclinatum TaxID=197538 RepID=A0A7S3IP49_9SPIT|mmetsp:Transcript_31663/g.48434  ORF Transcript_31663/g.48434 Transcript_31663/m.48434 type:complete len:264 (+) Transcript_31663:1182-1973(+)
MDFIAHRSLKSIENIDQKIIIFNILLSEHVLGGHLDLQGTSLSEIYKDASPTIDETPDIFNLEKLLEDFQSVSLAELQVMNKTPIVHVIAKAMHLGDDEVKKKVISIFKDILLIGKNFHYEVSNRHLRCLMVEMLDFYGRVQRDAVTDFYSFKLLDSLNKIIEFKVTQKTIDFKTFITIMQKDLDTSTIYEPLKLWRKCYATYILEHLESKSEKELTFRELDVIQRLIERDQGRYIQDTSMAYKLTVEKSMDRMLWRDRALLK